MAETKTRSKKAKPRKAAASKPKAKAQPVSKPKGLIDKSKAAGESVEASAKDAGHTVGRAVSKAKVPLMAGGAAMAGAAGGIALGAHRAHRRNGLGKIDSKDLARAARKAGDVGAQVGEIALEVRRARQHTNGDGRRRSPIEVVLQGLTSRG